MRYKNILKYNRLWESGRIKKPILILIGGYCGTGKSTLANNIAEYFPRINILPTGIIRSTLQHSLKPSQNPFIYEHTYNLHKIGELQNMEQRIIHNFDQQVLAVADAINFIIKFVSTERQNYIIEGNHIIAGNNLKLDDVIIIDIYTKVTDPSVHFGLMSGPTHNREIDQEQFNTGRIIQNYIIRKARNFRKHVFEYNVASEQALKLIDDELGKALLGYQEPNALTNSQQTVLNNLKF